MAVFGLKVTTNKILKKKCHFSKLCSQSQVLMNQFEAVTESSSATGFSVCFQKKAKVCIIQMHPILAKPKCI